MYGEGLVAGKRGTGATEGGCCMMGGSWVEIWYRVVCTEWNSIYPTLDLTLSLDFLPPGWLDGD